MQASLRSIRIAPKKAQLVAKLIRGKSVPEAVEILDHTNKKAAVIFGRLLRSAMANASHNEKQDPQMMIIKTLTVNKAQSYHRGVPMARGRVRPMRKFLSHIEMSLGFEEENTERNATNTKNSKNAKRESSQSSQSSPSSKSSKNTSKETKKPVKPKATTAKKPSTPSTQGKSTKKETATKTSKSSTSSKSSPKK